MPDLPHLPAPTPARLQLLTGPPMIGPVTLRDWLIHHSPRDNAWAHVTHLTFQIILERPHLASFFAGMNRERQERHVTAALAVVAHKGVSLETLLLMKEKHQHVRDEEGRPIIGLWFDEVIEILGGVLIRQGVPHETVRELVETVAPLRDAIILPSVRT